MTPRYDDSDGFKETPLMDWIAETAQALQRQSAQQRQNFQPSNDSPLQAYAQTSYFRDNYDEPATEGPEARTKVAMGLHPLTGLALYALNGVTTIPDVHVDFRQLNLKKVRYPHEKLVAKASYMGANNLKTMPIFDKFSDRVGSLDQFSIGFMLFKIQGMLILVNQEFWHFAGVIIPDEPDTFDFRNRHSSHRSDVENALTDLGSLIPGKPYRIHFHGEQPYEDTGTY